MMQLARRLVSAADLLPLGVLGAGLAVIVADARPVPVAGALAAALGLWLQLTRLGGLLGPTVPVHHFPIRNRSRRGRKIPRVQVKQEPHYDSPPIDLAPPLPSSQDRDLPIDRVKNPVTHLTFDVEAEDSNGIRHTLQVQADLGPDSLAATSIEIKLAPDDMNQPAGPEALYLTLVCTDGTTDRTLTFKGPASA